jgi:PleD family two-component response regulator
MLFTYPSGAVVLGFYKTRVLSPAALLRFTKNIRKRTYVFSDPATQIFVVDDEPVIASSLAAILKLNGYSATFFTSPLGALAAAQLRAPDLLISDLGVSSPGAGRV